jgi:hypothetical protein
MEPFLKEQPDNFSLIGDLALTNMSLGDKVAALAMSERAIAANPVEKDAVTGPIPIEILARVAARAWESPTAPSALYRNFSLHRIQAHSRLAYRSLLRFSGSIPCSIRSGMIRVF